VSTTPGAVDLLELIRGRASVYELLSRIFLVEVDPPFLDYLRQADFSIHVDNADLTEGYALLRTFQRNIDERTLLDLAVDYVRAFIGSGQSGDSAAYPYESVYTSPDHLIMQDARDEVLDHYRQEGMGKPDSFPDPEDHVALELSFMAHLNRRALELFESGQDREAIAYLEKQRHFLEEHLLTWVPKFCDDVPRFAQGDLYLGVAKVTRGFLAVEKELISDLLDQICEPVG
jgi:TorA maturation chaperone TorD